jgi:hypothetical protein
METIGSLPTERILQSQIPHKINGRLRGGLGSLLSAAGNHVGASLDDLLALFPAHPRQKRR